MNTPLRHVMVVLLGCFCLLFLQLNRVQLVDAESLQDNPANTRTLLRDYDVERATIMTRDGVVVASSSRSDGGVFQLQRTYPEGELYAHTVGYISFTVGAEGAERSYNDEIVGRTAQQQLANLTDLLDASPDPGSVTLTLDHRLQQVAREQLGERQGSIVAIDPRDGSVLALWSWPSFDPNRVSSNNTNEANDAYQELLEAEGNPLRARAYRDIEFPGSTFKVITAAAALESGAATLTDPVFPATTSYTPPLTSRSISNFGGRECGGDLVELLVQSCNAPFAELAAETLGPFVMVNQAKAAGFNAVPPFDLPGAVASNYPTDYGAQLQAPSPAVPAGLYENTPLLAQTAIGQNDVKATPLQMALMVAGIANDGIIPSPHVVDEITDSDGRVVDRIEPDPWRMTMEAANARILQDAMIQSGERGTGTAAAVDGLVVGVKTGTAQRGTDPPLSNAWIVGFAGLPGEDFEIAVAVLVEGEPGTGDQTGGRVAGPIAHELFLTYFDDILG
ncbi:MAG: penicillin-binding protein 2 [Actinomycetia bacterium]|nr:penicillin-binding protein 2 [Actinomycetes bacterium]